MWHQVTKWKYSLKMDWNYFLNSLLSGDSMVNCIYSKCVEVMLLGRISVMVQENNKWFSRKKYIAKFTRGVVILNWRISYKLCAIRTRINHFKNAKKACFYTTTVLITQYCVRLNYVFSQFSSIRSSIWSEHEMLISSSFFFFQWTWTGYEEVCT